MKSIKIGKLNLIFIIIIIFLIGFIAGIVFIPKQYKEEIIYQGNGFGEKTVELGIPAVDSYGNGVIGILSTTVRPGSGLVLVNINDVLAQYDTQYSGRVAAKVAGDYTNTNMSTLDVIYNIKVNASIIEGPSAGASMAVSIILALENKTTKNVMITGTIDEDGSIGPVGAIYEKAMVAKSVNAAIFLVPPDQSKGYGYKREKICEKLNSIEYCKIKYIADDINIGETINITVKEVKNIEEAMKYFIQG
jgi:uncharacterized protein